MKNENQINNYLSNYIDFDFHLKSFFKLTH